MIPIQTNFADKKGGTNFIQLYEPRDANSLNIIIFG